MPRLFHKPVNAERKAFLAVPCTNGVTAGLAFALHSSSAALSLAGWTAELAILDGDCHVDDARNSLVKSFLASDCEVLVFIDSDIRFEPESLAALLAFDADVVGASYPYKDDDEGFPVAFMPGEIWADAEG